MKGFVFHHLDLFDHSIRYYCRGCASAGKIAERDKKKVHNYLKSCLGISGDFEMSFIVDSDNRRV
jgi:hypothetical protein